MHPAGQTVEKPTETDRQDRQHRQDSQCGGG